jgi:hypothetical protein
MHSVTIPKISPEYWFCKQQQQKQQQHSRKACLDSELANAEAGA